jgi:hypothetical protein
MTMVSGCARISPADIAALADQIDRPFQLYQRSAQATDP